MAKFLVQIKETCVRTTSVEIEAQFAEEAREIAKISEYTRNDFSIVYRDTDIVGVEMIKEINPS